MNYNFNDLSGKKFNRLIGVKPVGKTRDRKIVWLFKCDCGKEHKAVGKDVKNGHIKSCGCLKIETTTKIGKTNITHGYSSNGKKTKTYITWRNMLGRCKNKNDVGYKYYGKRGIMVCSRWLPQNNGFVNFLNDIGEISKGKSLDRINNNGNYCPENCKLSTMKEQSRNKSNNITIEYNGKTVCLITLAEKYKIKLPTLRYRLNKGMSIKEALTTQVRKMEKKK